MQEDDDGKSSCTKRNSSKNSNNSSSSITKQEKFTPAKKEKVKVMYESLDKSMMWEVRPGLFVEEEVAKFGPLIQ